MMSGFETIVMYFGMSVLVVIIMLGGAYILGPSRPSASKQSTYECGMPLLHLAHTRRYAIKYFLVAILFLVFDLETVLIFPLAVRYHELAAVGWGAFFEIFIFVAILLAGLIYAIKKGAIEWD